MANGENKIAAAFEDDESDGEVPPPAAGGSDSFVVVLSGRTGRAGSGASVEAPTQLPPWLVTRVGDLDGSAHDHDGDAGYFRDKLKYDREVIARLLALVSRYGMTLPQDAAGLLEALSLVAPLDEKSAGALVGFGGGVGAFSGVSGAGGASYASVSTAPPRGRRIFSEASEFFGKVDAEHGIAEKFVRLQSELPSQSSVTTTFRHLSYRVRRAAGAKANPTVGDMCVKFWSGLACLVPSVLRAAAGRGPKKTEKMVLKDLTGVFRPGEITVLLGPPGSGKSALLKVLSGRVHTDKNHVVEGELLYNGVAAGTGAFVRPKVVQMVEERDQHMPTLTVQETLVFAFDSMDGGHHAAWIPEEERTPEQSETIRWMDERKAKVQLVMRALGLYNAKDTIVGNELLRGVSGGERRRVTSGEMIVGSYDVMLMDSISTGLDSSTTFDITSTLRDATRTFKKSIVVALLQPPPEVYELFDNVCLMAGGHIIYHGPVAGVLPHFAALGYECPPRKDTADFLVEVPTDQGLAYLSTGAKADLENGGAAPPRTPAEFAARWKETELFKAIEAELTAPKDPAAPPYKWPPNQTEPYAGSWLYHFKLCFRKHFLIFRRDTAYIRQRIVTCVVMGLILGSIFFNLDTQDVNAVFGVIFFCLAFLSLTSISSIPMAIKYRAVIYKQTDANFYPASADTFAQVFVGGSLQIVEALVFAPIVYSMVGFSWANSGRRFFSFMALLVLTNLNMSAYFRALAAIFSDFSKAQSFAGISVVFVVLFCGFLVPASDIPGVWVWIFWLNPLAWAFRAAAINEFTSPAYSANDLGMLVLDQYGFATDTAFVWSALIFILGEFLLVTALTAAALTFVRFETADNAPMTDEDRPATDEELRAHAAAAALTGAADGDGAAGDDGVAKGNGVGCGADEKEGGSVASRRGVWVEEASRGNSSVGGPMRARELSRAGSVAALQNAQAKDGLAFTPVTLSFHDMWYSVPHPSGDGELDLLKGITGFCEPGKMTALMGSSGAGKTTLLDVLAGRKNSGTIRGDILLNGQPKDDKTFTRIAGYCEQNDIHSPAVTVREAVAFSAELRLPHKEWDAERKKGFVDGVMAILELDAIADSVVGDQETGGLSIEQRKRLTIGVELAANPSLLFLDEPTSGLDARAAQVVMNAIRRVAATGRTVIATIHQPSTFLFEMFDSLLLLKKGGETVYFGELGAQSACLVEYLAQIPGTPPLRHNQNPSTWMLEAIGAGTASRANPQVYADYYAASILRQQNDARLEQQTLEGRAVPPLKFDSVFAAPVSVQKAACLKRAFAQYWRSASYNFSRIAIAVAVAIIFASSFVNQSVETEAQLASRLGVLYMVTTFIGVVMFQQSIPFFARERAVLYREQSAKMYTFQAYAYGYGIAELPYQFATTLLFAIIFYFMAGFEADGAKFWWFWLFFHLFVMFMSYLGHFFTAIMPSVAIAQTMGGVINSLFSVFAGFLISPAKIPNFWIWAYWINPAHYAIEGIVTTQYHDNTDPVETLTGTVDTNVYVDEFFGGFYKFSHRFQNVGILFAFVVLARIGFFLAIRYVRHEKR